MAVTSLIAGAEAVAPVRTGFGLACLLWLSPAAAEVQHALDVTLDAEHGHIEVTDTITLADNGAAQSGFVLHPALSPQALTPGVRLIAGDGSTANAEKATKPDSPSAKLEPLSYRVLLPAGRRSFTLHYQGDIHHAPQQGGPDYTRGFSETPGLITKQGAFLSGSSFWYPQFADELQTFELTLHLPRGWYGMSQGERLGREVVAQHVTERWRSAQPQQEIYLIAGPFTEYTSAAGPVQAMVLLRQPDAALARKYLDATARYIRLYSDLIGPYPYGKFALVENFWETGYGMPSFTLLGSKVIRFPFILYSSYPHEILHNWWGNGVYVDYAHGNWSEGLTSYLADHLIKEQRGQAVDYRRSTLQKYTDHVRGQQDFPLTQFRSRHSAVTEAVGYGKTLMLFHMLRRELGDETFIRALRVLYRDNLFKVAGYAQVEGAFSEAAQRPLGDFFAQWTQRSGAPQLRVSQAQARARDADFVLSAVIEQVQDEAPYTLEVPLAIGLEGREQGWQTRVRLEGRRTTLELVLPARPLQLKVDPEFDVFRRLDRAEIPPAISQALGDERLLIVLPDAAPEELRQAYEAVAKTWQAGQNGRIEVVGDSTLDVLPGDRSVWLFGWQNRFRHQLADAMEGYDYHDRGATVQIAGTALNEREHAVVVMGRRAADSAHALGWLATARVAALPGLARKLPHYGKYSYLAFSGDAPDNVLKGQWPVVDSPLSVSVVQGDGVVVTPGAMLLAPRVPLVEAPPEFSAERMQRDIAVLADVSMEGRGLGTPALDRAARYVADRMHEAGLRPGGDAGTWLQTWQTQLPETGESITLHNVVGVLPGTDPGRTGESLVIGAHYDHLGRGERGGRADDRGLVHPGADDNASGVSVMLELARALAGRPQPRSIVFVAFTGEETGRLGSQHFVQNAGAYPVDRMIAMVNLDTVGRLGARPLLALGSGGADEWVHILRGAGYVTGVEVKAVADDIGSSDQTSFIEAGVPAVQLFAGAHADFHRPGDTADRIDAAGLVKTAQVLKEVATYLAQRPEALNSTLGAKQRIHASGSTPAPRRVSLGIVPDYAGGGEGVRIDEVRAGTPAAQAGLQAGDAITALNGTTVGDLRDYTRVLRELAPGDAVEIVFMRDGAEHRVGASVVERR